MAFHSPRQSQHYYDFNPSTPPPPPPKPSAHSSGTATPQTAPPHLPPSTQSAQHPTPHPYAQTTQAQPRQPSIPLPEDGWLPHVLQDKTYVTVETLDAGC